ncbi:MAG: calcium/sodium antiporter [Prevotella sp.]
MIIDVLSIIIGIVIVLMGADKLTAAASSLARGMKIPEIVIGMTVVSMGTSAPELFVSLTSALQHTPDMALGNVIGSNIFNTLLIVGCAAAVAPMTISHTTVSKDIPFSVLASVVLVVLCMDDFSSIQITGHLLSRTDGTILLLCLAGFMWQTYLMAMRERKDKVSTIPPSMSWWRALLWMALGLGALVLGSDLFVSSASDLAVSLGMSQAVVGLTIVAGGTSLPELATSVVAAYRGRSAIAIGNVIGSNVFNILAILGITAFISPLHISGITPIDFGLLLGSVSLLWLFSFTKYTVARWEGWVLILIFGIYMGWLLWQV